MIKINCSNINYCVGPCNNTQEETTDHKWLKPFSGGRYEQFIWKTKTNKLLKLYNLRICNSCNQRYLEMHDGVSENDPSSISRMHKDADQILTKLSL